MVSKFKKIINWTGGGEFLSRSELKKALGWLLIKGEIGDDTDTSNE